MTAAYVIDASVAFKWLFTESLSDVAKELSTSNVSLCAPRLVLIEVSNAIWKNVRAHRVRTDVALTHLDMLPGFFNELIDEFFLMADALKLAVELDHPVYDCIYLALAQHLGIPLVTADQRLITKLADQKLRSQIVALAEFAK